jgi:hypothetical protein
MEKVIFRQFTIYLNSREFFDQKQSGFRAGHSYTTALLEITEDVRTAAEVEMITILFLESSCSGCAPRIGWRTTALFYLY